MLNLYRSLEKEAVEEMRNRKAGLPQGHELRRPVTQSPQQTGRSLLRWEQGDKYKGGGELVVQKQLSVAFFSL